VIPDADMYGTNVILSVITVQLLKTRRDLEVQDWPLSMKLYDTDGVIWEHIGNTLTESTLGLEVSLVGVYSIVLDKWSTQNCVHILCQKPNTFYKSRHLHLLCHTDKRGQFLQCTRTADEIRINHATTEIKVKVKVKFSCYRPVLAQKVDRGIALLFHDRGTRRGEWSAARPGRTLPPGKSQYPLCRRLGGPKCRSGRAENLVPIGIRSRNVQPVFSRYTDWATRPRATTGIKIINYLETHLICTSPPPRISKQSQSVRNTVAIKEVFHVDSSSQSTWVTTPKCHNFARIGLAPCCQRTCVVA
jgi:hypothetical protein